MSRQRLTVERIKNFTCLADKKQVFLWDSDAPGLGVRATAGAKVFIFQDKLDGKTIRITIGDVRSWPVDSNDKDKPGARQEARRLQTMVDKGIDPRAEKKKRIEKEAAEKRENARVQITVSEAWKEYLKERKSKWGQLHYLWIN